MKKICILKTGAAPAKIRAQLGDFDDYIMENAGISTSQTTVFPVYLDHHFPDITAFDGVIITGSYDMITEPSFWLKDAEAWLLAASGESVPILGICYGHQLIAKALNGAVDYHPGGSETGMVEIELTDAGKKDPLLRVLPERFCSLVNHSQTVLSLPDDTCVLAKNDFEPHHAIRRGDHIWGVQFHPEFAKEYMQIYLQLEKENLLAAGWDWENLNRSLSDNVYGSVLLQRFISLL